MALRDELTTNLLDSLEDLHETSVAVIEQCYTDAIYALIKKGVKEEKSSFKVDCGFGDFVVTPDVGKDNSNIHLEFSKDFKKIIEGDQLEILIEKSPIIEAFSEALTKSMYTVNEAVAGTLIAIIAETVAKAGRSHMREDSVYSMEFPRLGDFKFGFKDGDVKLNFVACEELKQEVKNFGI
jgi:hypothetical protein